jgi:hypothetical protein
LYPANGLISKLPALISERADKGNKKTKTAIIIAVRYIDFIAGPPLYCRVLQLPLRLFEKTAGDILVLKERIVAARQKETG